MRLLAEPLRPSEVAVESGDPMYVSPIVVSEMLHIFLISRKFTLDQTTMKWKLQKLEKVWTQTRHYSNWLWKCDSSCYKSLTQLLGDWSIVLGQVPENPKPDLTHNFGRFGLPAVPETRTFWIEHYPFRLDSQINYLRVPDNWKNLVFCSIFGQKVLLV